MYCLQIYKGGKDKKKDDMVFNKTIKIFLLSLPVHYFLLYFIIFTLNNQSYMNNQRYMTIGDI